MAGVGGVCDAGATATATADAAGCGADGGDGLGRALPGRGEFLEEIPGQQGNVLAPLGLKDCVRVSFSHYNSLAEVAQFLTAMNEFTSAQ